MHRLHAAYLASHVSITPLSESCAAVCCHAGTHAPPPAMAQGGGGGGGFLSGLMGSVAQGRFRQIYTHIGR